MEQASALFNPSPKEAEPEPEPKSTQSTPDSEEFDNFEDGPFDADVVDALDLPPVRSNVNPDQPLRPKPPSDGVFRVTPSPSFQTYGQLGVQNPHYFSENFYRGNGPTTENYGPDDFIVETVKLDKDFFQQFFTSKPLLIGTDIVTSTSVKVDKSFEKLLPRKRSRKTSAELPDPLIDIGQTVTDLSNQPSTLFQMALEHVENKRQSYSTTTKLSTTTTTPTPATTSTTTMTTPSPYFSTTSDKISDVPKIINSVKTFTRYYIPPEVKISSKAVGAAEE